jgi:tetratricopeptide (TPR) repeat protein
MGCAIVLYQQLSDTSAKATGKGGCAMSDNARTTFDRANHLWFWEGRTHEAVRLYEKAARDAPANVAILFQLARAQWALGMAAAARATLDKARAQSAELTETGADLLARFDRQLASGSRLDLPAGLRADDLDVERLESLTLPVEDWSQLASAAQAQGAYGVALFAKNKAKGLVTIIDEEKEEWDLIKEAESTLSLLDLLPW